MERSGTETVWRRLSADGLRRTTQREAILDALSDAGEALPLPVLLARGRRRAPGLGERTAERTVALLVDRGAVDAITRAGGEVVYRLCGWGHHHHLVCSLLRHRRPSFDQCDIAGWAADQAERQGFLVEGHEVTVHGVCGGCRDVSGTARPALSERRRPSRPRGPAPRPA